MCGDHLSDGVCVDQADIKDEGDDVAVQDDGVEGEVERDERPCDGEGDQAEKGDACLFASFAAGGEGVLGAGTYQLMIRLL